MLLKISTSLYCFFLISVLFSDYYNPDISKVSSSILQGYGFRQTTGILSKWQKSYFILYPNRLEIGESLMVSKRCII